MMHVTDWIMPVYKAKLLHSKHEKQLQI